MAGCSNHFQHLHMMIRDIELGIISDHEVQQGNRCASSASWGRWFSGQSCRVSIFRTWHPECCNSRVQSVQLTLWMLANLFHQTHTSLKNCPASYMHHSLGYPVFFQVNGTDSFWTCQVTLTLISCVVAFWGTENTLLLPNVAFTAVIVSRKEFSFSTPEATIPAAALRWAAKTTGKSIHAFKRFQAVGFHTLIWFYVILASGVLRL